MRKFKSFTFEIRFNTSFGLGAKPAYSSCQGVPCTASGVRSSIPARSPGSTVVIVADRGDHQLAQQVQVAQGGVEPNAGSHAVAGEVGILDAD
jgi:hypothetical protein